MTSANNAEQREVLWEGQRNSLTAQATGGRVVSSRYKLTAEYLVFEAGLLSTAEERVPLWSLGDVDLTQNMSQKVRGLGDIKIRVLNNYLTGRDFVVLESIPDPKDVRDLIDREVTRSKAEHLRQQHTQHVEHTNAAPSLQGPTSSSAQDLTTLELLIELHQREVIDAPTFADLASKAK